MSSVAFKVMISNVRCEGLKHPVELRGDVDETVDAYVTFGWPGRGQKYNTKVIRNNRNPVFEDWSQDFYYSTRYPEQLAQRKLLVTVTDWNRWKSHKLIGVVEIDLKTMATGPIRHDLSVLAQNGDVMGRIRFDVEMQEVVRNMKLELFDVMLPNWIPNATPGAKVCVECSLSARPEDRILTTLLPASVVPTWPRTKPLKLSIDVNDLLDYGFTFQVHFVVNKKTVPFLRGSSFFLDMVSKTQPIKTITIPLKMTSDPNQQAGNLQVTAKITNGPRFLQILDAKAVHNDKGIMSKKGRSSDYFPLPPGGIIGEDAKGTELEVDESDKAKIHSKNMDSEEKDDWLYEPRASSWKPEDDMIPLPRHWSMRKEGRAQFVRFMYRPTKQVTYQDPRGLPPGWTQCLTTNGKLYWYQKSTGGTTKTDPRGLPKDWDLVLMKTPNGCFVKRFIYQHMLRTKVDPRGLPERFSQHVTAQGKVYYMDHQEMVTTFSDPRTLMPKEMIAALAEDDIRKWMRVFWANAATLINVEKTRIHEEQQRLLKEKQLEFEHETKVREVDMKFANWVESKGTGWMKSADAFDKEHTAKLQKLRAEKEDLEKKLMGEIEKWEEEQMKKLREQKDKMIGAGKANLEKLAQSHGKTREKYLDERKQWIEKFMKEKKEIVGKMSKIYETEKKKLEEEFTKEKEAFNREETATSIQTEASIVEAKVVGEVQFAGVGVDVTGVVINESKG